MRPATVAFLLPLALALGCGEVRTLDTEFTPSLTTFVREVQPALDAQGCGRGPDEEHGIAGCHTPEQGGLRLVHKPDSEAVLLNYRNSVPFVNLDDPAASPLLLAPLNGPLPPEERDGESLDRSQRVDHPDYAGRFASVDGCCYCRILAWICQDDPRPECVACRDRLPCNDCQAVTQCQPGGSGTVEEQEAFEAVVGTLNSKCGSCHGFAAPPLAARADILALVGPDGTGSAYLTPCQGGGSFLGYVDGNNNDPMHSSALNADERGALHVWVEELGAPVAP